MLELIERKITKKPWMDSYSFILVQSLEQLKDIIDKAIHSKLCSFDLETTGLDTRIINGKCKSVIVGYSLCFEPKIGYYIPVRHRVENENSFNLNPKEVAVLIQRLINEANIVGHNWLKFDAEMLYASEGVILKEDVLGKEYPYHDTYILARLAGKSPSNLKFLSKTLLNKEMLEIEEVVSSKENIDFSSIFPSEGLLYAACDAICTYELFYHPEIQAPIKEQATIYAIERKLMKVVRKMERNKIKLNKEWCEKLDQELLGTIQGLEVSLFKDVEEKTEGRIKEFKLDSPEEVSHILFDVYDMEPKPERGKKGNYKTDDEVLEKLAENYPLAKKMQEYRTSTKFYRTYIKNMLLNVDEEGCLKFNFSSLRTDSGRFASPGKSDDRKFTDGYSGVNIQSTPARYDKSKPNVRKCISCEDDEVIAALDWSGVELRVATNLSKEPIWMDRFLKSDGDIHTSTASIILDKPESDINKEERQLGKTFNFQTVYGGGPGALATATGISVEDARIKQGKYFGRLKGLQNWIKHTQREAEKKGYCLTAFGRKRLLPEFSSDVPRIRANALRKSINTPVQGCIYGDARILVKNKGFVKIKDLVGSIGIEIWEGNKFIKADCVYSGKKKKIKVCFWNGQEIICSPEHKFLTVNTQGNKLWKTYKDFSKQEHIALTNEADNFNYNYVLKEDTKKTTHNKKFISLNKLKNKYELGLLLGRFASDGSMGGNNVITWLVAEHEYTILEKLEKIIKELDPKYIKKTVKRKKENRKDMVHLNICSITLMKQMRELDLKNSLNHPFIWSSKELLRGFLCGYFDGDGGVTGKFPSNRSGVRLTFGKGNKKISYAKEIQKALNIFGIQTRVNLCKERTHVNICSYYKKIFARKIGFINKIKQNKLILLPDPVKTKNIMGCVERVKKVIVYDQFIDMFDIVNCPDKKYMADGLIVHNTAADLMKLAMMSIDKYIEENKLDNKIQMLLTMHDELVFRVKKSHIPIIKDIEKAMRLENILKKIRWEVGLQVDVEIGSSWDIDYEYKEMQDFLKEKKGTDKVSFIYEKDADYNSILKEYKEYKDTKKGKKKIKQEVKSLSTAAKDDFKKIGDFLKEKEVIIPELPTQIEPLKETPTTSISQEPTATAQVEEAFKVLNEASLGDLPIEAYEKLKKSFYKEEFIRILEGSPSLYDNEVELPIIVHSPIDTGKKNILGYIIESCPGNGKVKFLTQEKEELHEDWINADVIKVAIMSKIFNL